MTFILIEFFFLVFQLVTISEYHVKQMHDNAPSSFISEDDTDTSASSDNHNFIQSIGLIYQSKVHMLCQAYDLYAKGISTANHLLSELRRNEDFVRFVRDPPLEGNQPSISTFIYRPVQHIRELYKVVQEVFTNTSSGSSDYNSLKELTEGNYHYIFIYVIYLFASFSPDIHIKK
jgi:regulator of G-protein signaling 3